MDTVDNQNRLLMIWSARDADVARNMVFMYAKNSRLREWWEEVCVVVWGPSAELLATDASLQDEIRAAMDAGVELKACKACADRYGVSEKLADMGIEVDYMGQPLTACLKDGWTVLTF